MSTQPEEVPSAQKPKDKVFIQKLDNITLKIRDELKKNGIKLKESGCSVSASKKIHPRALIERLEEFNNLCNSKKLKSEVQGIIEDVKNMCTGGDTRMFICHDNKKDGSKLEFICLVVYKYNIEKGEACGKCEACKACKTLICGSYRTCKECKASKPGKTRKGPIACGERRACEKCRIPVSCGRCEECIKCEAPVACDYLLITEIFTLNKSGVNWIPGVSQIKAGLQYITGDKRGAKETSEDFIHECPIVSQITSVVQLIKGDKIGAKKTQKRCLGTLNNVANGVPVVGHIKGGIHHLAGDHKGGNRALNSASRSTVVIGSGIVAGIFTAGVAGIPAGIAAGAAYDSAHSLITKKPQGLIAGIDNAIDNPSAGTIFDAVMIPVGDGLGGYGGAKIGNIIKSKISAGSSGSSTANAGGNTGGSSPGTTGSSETTVGNTAASETSGAVTSDGGTTGSSGSSTANAGGNTGGSSPGTVGSSETAVGNTGASETSGATTSNGRTTGAVASKSKTAGSKAAVESFETASFIDWLFRDGWKSFFKELFEAMDKVGDDMIFTAFEHDFVNE